MVGGNDSPQPLTTENLWNLSQDKLKEIIKQVSKVRKTKYERRKTRKYGNLNKGFTEEELKKFLKFCDNPKAKLAFQLMAYLGLRVGEVVKIKLSDLDFKHNKIRIDTEKGDNKSLPDWRLHKIKENLDFARKSIENLFCECDKKTFVEVFNA